MSKRAASPPGTGRLPTSVDIARLAGVSQATVSRVLNGGSASEPTRRRILQVADQLGYSVNGVARGLAMRRTGLIGVVVADITNPFYPELLESVGARLGERGWQMLVHDADADSEVQATKLLLQQRVDGILFTSALTGSEAVVGLAQRGFPLVLSNRVVNAACDAVEGDNVRGAQEVAELLTSLGHRRIAMLKGHPRASTTEQRNRGFKGRLAELGVELREELEVTANFSYQRAFDAARELLAQRWRPTAIFCHNDLMAFATLNAALASGLSVPGDLSVVGYDDVALASWAALDLTCVRQPLAEMASKSVELLVERLAEPTLPPRHIVFDCSLMVRGTTGPPPRRK